jgi:hypothetical protein
MGKTFEDTLLYVEKDMLSHDQREWIVDQPIRLVGLQPDAGW